LGQCGELLLATKERLKAHLLRHSTELAKQSLRETEPSTYLYNLQQNSGVTNQTALIAANPAIISNSILFLLNLVKNSLPLSMAKRKYFK
jgi:hypothetical protein